MGDKCIRRQKVAGLFPDHVFIVTTVDQRVDFTVGSLTEQNSAFDIFAEEKL